MSKYHDYINPQKTPQDQPIFGRESEMTKNLAGGYAFPVTHWIRLERFLILGSEGGTYYIRPRELTIENARAIQACLKEDSKRTVDTIVGISLAGRAAKNDPAIFALAMASSPRFNPESRAREYALGHLSEVCRIGTHLFTFVEYVNSFRGWGRQLRHAVARWYVDKTPHRLAYQMAKYQRRGGWSHHDVLHMAHPSPESGVQNLLFQWAKSGWDEESMRGNGALAQLEGMERAKSATTAKEIIALIEKHRLAREMIPNKWFDDVSVWRAMLETMPMTAMIRNLGKMTQVGLLGPLASATSIVTARLREQERITNARIHPWLILNAQHQYGQGHGRRGKLEWKPNQPILDAMDDAFGLSFGNVVPTNKRVCICLDVSGSMNWAQIADGSGGGMAAAQAAGAMALITARTEPNYHILLFNMQAREAHINAKSSLRDVVRGLKNEIGGGTSYQAGIDYADRADMEVDAFVIYGDEQSWHGTSHISQRVAQYREKRGIPTKLVINNFCSTETTVADPADAGSAHFVGMDTHTPRLISEFIRGD